MHPLGGGRTTQQPTTESNQKGIGQICVEIWRATDYGNTTISPISMIEVDTQLCCEFVRYVALKLNEITTQNFTMKSIIV